MLTVAGSAGWSLDEDDRCAGTSCDHGDGGRSRAVVLTGTLMAISPSSPSLAATPRLAALCAAHPGYLRVALPGAECERLHRRPCVTETPRIARRDARGHRMAPESRRAIAPGPSRTGFATVAADFQRPAMARRRKPTKLGRRGPAEAAVDLARLAERRPAAALCETVSPDNPSSAPRRSRSNSPSNTDGPRSRSGSWYRRIEPGGLRQRRCPPGRRSRVIGCDVDDPASIWRSSRSVPGRLCLHVHIERLTRATQTPDGAAAARNSRWRGCRLRQRRGLGICVRPTPAQAARLVRLGGDRCHAETVT